MILQVCSALLTFSFSISIFPVGVVEDLRYMSCTACNDVLPHQPSPYTREQKRQTSRRFIMFTSLAISRRMISFLDLHPIRIIHVGSLPISFPVSCYSPSPQSPSFLFEQNVKGERDTYISIWNTPRVGDDA